MRGPCAGIVRYRPLRYVCDWGLKIRCDPAMVLLSWNRLIPPNFNTGLTMMNNNFLWSKQQNPRLPLPWAAVAGSRSEDYELSAEEASELIAALGGTSQQRAGYREPLGNQSTVDRSGMEQPRAK